MPLSFIYYELQDGYIHNWLVAGPQVIPPSGSGERPEGDAQLSPVAAGEADIEAIFRKLPAERGPLTQGTFRVGDYEGVWSYYRCCEDHLIDKAAQLKEAILPAGRLARCWAYAQVVTRKPQEVLLTLTTFGPADIWLNKAPLLQEKGFSDSPRHVSLPVRLRSGPNKFLLRFAGYARMDAPLAVGLRLVSASADPARPSDRLRVRLPTLIPSVQRRSALEQIYDAAYIDRDVFEWEAPIRVQWPEGGPDLPAEATFSLAVRLQTPAGQIYAQADPSEEIGTQIILNSPYNVPEGPLQILLMPRLWEFYDRDLRYTHVIPLWGLGLKRFSEAPYDTYAERRYEALQQATKRENDLFAELAKMALGRWKELDAKAISTAVEIVRQSTVGGEHVLLGLIGTLYRFGDQADFPAALKQRIEECLPGFAAWSPEPGAAESRAILFYAAEALAGQLFSEHTFADGKTGEWHRAHGEQQALEWLYARAAVGFADWDSDVGFAEILFALSHLVEFTEREELWDMSAVLMDKLFFSLALNSYKGVFGSTHGSTTTASIKNAQLEATSGISRLMWGMGLFNHHLSAVVSLALMEKYQLPTIIHDIATAQMDELWSREQHASQELLDRRDQPSALRAAVNKVTYKTPDFMLCSAQDYYPGQPGRQEHIWQATLGPGAAVFVNHPACSSEADAYRPNFWRGNAILPRVAQWKDSLIAIYKLPKDDRMGFTHAYFPLYAFDEYALRDGWAFARRKDGYLALRASQGFELIRKGQSAFRELRSFGEENIWLCLLGRAALDGDFARFQEAVLALEIRFSGLSVRCQTLRGEMLSFGWEEPFLRDGQEQPLAGFKHYENPFTNVDLGSPLMEIRLKDAAGDEYLLRLNYTRSDSEEVSLP